MTPGTYEANYALLGLMILAAIGFALIPLLLARFISPKKPSAEKNATYECGLVSEGDPWVQLRVQYYLYALSFLIFSLEILFLIPAALAFTPQPGEGAGSTLFVFGNMLVFLVILVLGFLYEWKKGALEWK